MVKMKLSGFIYRRLVFFYGITLGLITVNASATFNDISDRVDREATSISSFYSTSGCDEVHFIILSLLAY